MKLHAHKFGLAFGIIYAALFFIYGLTAAIFGYGKQMMDMIGDFYFGFGPTIPGAFAGAAWGFAIGYVFFALAAAIYNKLLGKTTT